MDTCNDDSVIQIKYQVSKAEIKYQVKNTWYDAPGSSCQVQMFQHLVTGTMHQVLSAMHQAPVANNLKKMLLTFSVPGLS